MSEKMAGWSNGCCKLCFDYASTNFTGEVRKAAWNMLASLITLQQFSFREREREKRRKRGFQTFLISRGTRQ